MESGKLANPFEKKDMSPDYLWDNFFFFVIS